MDSGLVQGAALGGPRGGTGLWHRCPGEGTDGRTAGLEVAGKGEGGVARGHSLTLCSLVHDACLPCARSVPHAPGSDRAPQGRSGPPPLPLACSPPAPLARWAQQPGSRLGPSAGFSQGFRTKSLGFSTSFSPGRLTSQETAQCWAS